jgi:hypothetical protein
MRILDAIEADWDSAVGLLYIDCDGCEQALLPLLLENDRTLARIRSIVVHFWPQRWSPYESFNVRHFVSALFEAGFSQREKQSSTSLKVRFTARVSSATVLFNINAAVEAQLRPWRNMGGISRSVFAAFLIADVKRARSSWS